MRYDEILTRAAQIAWRRKYLWLLAILAGEGGGGSGGSGFNTSSFNGRGLGSSRSTSGTVSGPDLSPFASWVAGHLALLIAGGVVLLLIAAVWFVVGCVAAPAIVAAVARLDAGEDIRLRAAWSLGARRFWPVLGLKLLLALAILVPAVVIFGGILALAVTTGRYLLLLLTIPFGLLFIPWAIAVAVAYPLALRSIVLEHLGAGAGLRSAWRLFRRRPWRVLAVVGILIGVGIVIGIIAAIPVTLVALPFVGLAAAMYAAGNGTGLVGVIVAGGLVVLVIGLLVGGAIGSYYSAVWTLAYRRFDVEAGAPPAPALPA